MESAKKNIVLDPFDVRKNKMIYGESKLLDGPIFALMDHFCDANIYK